jgi:osmoprotectant transport system substrate-binding protein
MRYVRILAVTALLPIAAACGGSSSGSTGGVNASGSPSVKSDSSLVVLTDDKDLQLSDNVVAVVRSSVDKKPLTDVLDKVDTTLTQADLVAMNRRGVVNHDEPAAIAKDYVTAKGLGSGFSGGSGHITIGASNFAESGILANVYAKALEGAGYKTTVKNVQSREVYEPALEHGSLDVMPEYAASLTEFLNTKDNGAKAKPLATPDITKTMQALKTIAAKHHLVPLTPSTATDENAFAVRKDFAQKWGLRTLSDLTKVKGTLKLGGPPECPQRPFCELGLERTYGIHFTSFVSLDTGGPLTVAAIKQGKVQVGLVFSSDPSLASS